MIIPYWKNPNLSERDRIHMFQQRHVDIQRLWRRLNQAPWQPDTPGKERWLPPPVRGSKVLVWDGYHSIDGDLGGPLKTYLTGEGYTVDDISTYTTGTIQDYGTIFWLLPHTDVSAEDWLSTILAGPWAGRIVIAGESDGNLASAMHGVSDFINSIILQPELGMTIVPDSIDGGLVNHPANTVSDPLTSGVSGFLYFSTSTVSSGTVLFTTVTGSQPFVARHTFENIDFVLSGDSNCCRLGAGSDWDPNRLFFKNCIDVPLTP